MIENKDIRWLKYNYPGIVYYPATNTLQGCLWFKAMYSLSQDKFVVNPDETIILEDGFLIEDVYDLILEFAKDDSKVVAKEVGGRIMHAKKKWGLSQADVHMYVNNSLCLCPEPEQKLRLSNEFDLRDYFNYLLIPYLYFQSYLEKFGKEPWKSSSHGDLGILESYAKRLFGTTNLETMKLYINNLTDRVASTIIGHKPINRDDGSG